MKNIILVLASTLIFFNSVLANNIYESSDKIQSDIEKSIELQFEMAADKVADKNIENSLEFYSSGFTSSCSETGPFCNSNSIGIKKVVDTKIEGIVDIFNNLFYLEQIAEFKFDFSDYFD